MSKPDATPKLDLDLESAFLPAWAQKSAEENPYSKYEGRDRDFDSGDRRGRQRRDDFGGPPRRRDKNSPQGRGRQDGGARRDQGDRRGPREGGAGTAPGNGDRTQQRNRPQGARGQGRNFQGKGGPRRDRPRRSRQEILASLPQLKTQIIPEAKGVALLARRIRLQGRAYPLFDIAGLILQSPDRYQIRFTTQNAPKDQPQQKIWLCKIDSTVWLDESEAIQHILQKYLENYYSSERTEAEPPKGNFSFVAQCGISGIVLGPPNYHGYQTKLREVHGERFARMDFEHWKSKVKIVHEEEVVKKWLEEQSWTIEYADKANPEADKIHSLEEVESHFREHHLAEALECVNSTQVSGDLQKQVCRPIRELIRFHVEDQKRFPLQLATELSQQFTRQGLQFFKVNKTVTHVSVSRPHYLNLEATPVSETVKKIVQFIDETPDCTRAKVMDALAPAPAKAETDIKATEEAPAAIEVPPIEEAAQAPAISDGPETGAEAVSGETAASEAAASAEPEVKESEAVKTEPSMTPQQAAVSTDLHWLIHQGHVIEFSNGKMETAKKPKEQPPKKKSKPAAEKPAAKETGEAQASTAEASGADKSSEPTAESVAGAAPEQEASGSPETVEDEVKALSEPVSAETSTEEAKTEEATPVAAEEAAEAATPEPESASNVAEPEAPSTEEKPSNS
ncbi:MAG: hypothetical protein ACFHW5_15085 [Verrucomicrobiota bacterium]|jgi:hypothetical protein